MIRFRGKRTSVELGELSAYDPKQTWQEFSLVRAPFAEESVKRWSRAGLALQVEPAAEPLRDGVVDGVQPELGCAVMAAGGEKRIKLQPLDFRRHPTAIVGNSQLDMIVPRPRL
jgi:hypothetical protein